MEEFPEKLQKAFESRYTLFVAIFPEIHISINYMKGVFPDIHPFWKAEASLNLI